MPNRTHHTGSTGLARSLQKFIRTAVQEDEYVLLGMAIKYAGLRGKEVRVIGKNRSTPGEEDKIQ